MLSIQKSPLDKTDLSFKDSITVSKTHFTNFVSSSKPPVNEIVKPTKVTPPRKIRVDLKKSKSNTPNPPKDKLHDRPIWSVIFVESLGTSVQTVSSCKLLSVQISQKYLCFKHKIPWYLLVNW